MGRMLETFKNGEQARSASPDAPQAECVVDWSLPEPRDVPFIEVGGPRKMEASAQVLAAHGKVQPPHLAALRSAPQRQGGALAVDLTPAAPMAVALEAWPATRPARGVASDIIVLHQPDHPVSQQYLALLEQMTQLRRHGGSVLMLVGVRPGIGASTVLLNLAVASARQHGQRVVVWEARSHAASLAERLGLAPEHGIDAALRGSAALENVVMAGPMPGLFLLPARRQASSQAGVACSPEAARWLAAWLRERFDLVLIDGPTLDEESALSALAPLADDLYLVAPRGETQRTGLAPWIAGLGGRLRGIVHTHIEG